MPTVTLGNKSVVESSRDARDNPTQDTRKDLGQRVTTVHFPDDVTLTDQIRAIQDLWPYHSNEPPAWVESDDEDLQGVLADALQTKAGRPASFKEGKKR